MNRNVYLYILVMAGVTYLIRLLPPDIDKKGNQKCLYKILSLLCPLRNPVRHDLPGHPSRHGLPVVRRSRPGRCNHPGLQGEKPVPGIPGRVRRCFGIGTPDGLTYKEIETCPMAATKRQPQDTFLVLYCFILFPITGITLLWPAPSCPGWTGPPAP